MKLIQINKLRKCPCCKKYALITPLETGAGSSLIIEYSKEWYYYCKNCGAKFVEEVKQ